MTFVDKDLQSIQEARIIMENAREAKQLMAQFSQEKLDEMVENMIKAILCNLEELSTLEVEETGYGNVQDEAIQLELMCEALSTSLTGLKLVGILDRDCEKQIINIGVPLGVIAGICPAAGAAAAAVCTAVHGIKSGNAIVLVPHFRSQRTVKRVTEILAEAVKLSEGVLSCLKVVSLKGAEEVIKSPETSLIIDTGVPELLLSGCNKPIIYGQTASSPVFIERTADIQQAAEDIIISRSFNYGILSGAEQYLVVDSVIAEKVKEEMIYHGAYFMGEEEEKQLISFLCMENGEHNPEFIGKGALWLADRSGFKVPDTTKILVSEQKYISDRNPYARELKCPVMVYYIEHDWIHACEKCIELLLGENKGHTLVIHAQDEEVIRQFGLKKPVGRVLVNTSAAFGAAGLTTNLFPTVTLGGLPAGMGNSANNLSPYQLVYIRKLGYGVRRMKDLIKSKKHISDNIQKGKLYPEEEIDTMKFLQQILMKLSEESDQ
jgi:acyl-CoA reductase-like NAD-dependent aldehyde dehydrogenase